MGNLAMVMRSPSIDVVPTMVARLGIRLDPAVRADRPHRQAILIGDIWRIDSSWEQFFVAA